MSRRARAAALVLAVGSAVALATIGGRVTAARAQEAPPPHPPGTEARTAPGRGEVTSDPVVDRWLERASELTARGADARSRALLRRARRRAPGDVRVLRRLAEALLPPSPVGLSDLSRRRGEELLEVGLALRRGLSERFPGISVGGDAGELAARCLAAGGDLEAALAVIERWVAPRASTRTLDWVAGAAVVQGDLGRAQALLRRAHRRQPDLPRLAALGVLALARGTPEEAVPWLERAVRARPDDPGLRLDLAGALLAAGRGQRSLAVLEGGSSTGATVHPELALARVRVLVELARFQAALEAAPLAGSLGGDPFELALLEGRAAAAVGHEADARNAYRRALEIRPSSPRAAAGLEALASPR